MARSPVRTALVVVILAVCTGLALTMLAVNGAFMRQLGSISGLVGTEVQVRPAGSFALMGGGEPLDEAKVDALAAIGGVVSVHKEVTTYYTGPSLQSPIDPGTLGQRFRRFAASGMPVIVAGIDPAESDLRLFGGGTMVLSAGRPLAETDNNADVAIVGKDLAEKNGLFTGSIVDVDGTPVEVAGIFSTYQRFGDSLLVMSFDSAQRLFELENEVSLARVTVDSVDNIDSVVTAIRESLGAGVADIVTSTDQYERIRAPLAGATGTLQTGLLAALAVSGAVITFSVVLMVRQRSKEIGILKAIGASNRHIALQFGVETLSVSLLASLLGVLIAVPLTQRIAGLIGTRAGGSMAGLLAGRVPLASVQIGVSPETFLYALAIALGLAAAASIFPSWFIARLKPADVLRND